MQRIAVEEGNELYVYGELEGEAETGLRKAFAGLGGFSSYKVRGKTGPVHSGAAYNTHAICGCVRAYDKRLRPTTTLLRLLGRKGRGGGEEEEDERTRIGRLPDVQLEKSLEEQAAEDPRRELRINAETMMETMRAQGIRCGEGEGEEDPLAVWGSCTFSMTVAEARDLEASGRVVCDPSAFPPAFYTSLAALTTKHVAYYSDRRVQALAEIGKPEQTIHLRSMLEECMKRCMGLLQDLLASPKEVSEKSTSEEVQEYEKWAYQKDRYQGKLESAEISLKQLEHAPQIDSEHQAFIEKVRRDFKGYGFKDEDHVNRVLATSLNELSSSVCQTQKGYFMVGGAEGVSNQLCGKTERPLTFLTAAGIDFCTDLSTVVEGSKYFTVSAKWEATQPLRGKFEDWKGPREKTDFYERVKNLYKCIFTAAEVQGVTHPCVLPMGLGVFLDNVPEKCRDEVKRCYFRAQVELLQEKDWGFAVYVLNAGPPCLVSLAKKVVEETAGTAGEGLRCPIVVHSRDVKFIAVSLASMGYSAAYLNPSDAIAVLQGLIGYFWEVGKGSCYVGEEDFVATSTAILSRTNISDLHTDSSRVLST